MLEWVWAVKMIFLGPNLCRSHAQQLFDIWRDLLLQLRAFALLWSVYLFFMSTPLLLFSICLNEHMGFIQFHQWMLHFVLICIYFMHNVLWNSISSCAFMFFSSMLVAFPHFPWTFKYIPISGHVTMCSTLSLQINAFISLQLVVMP